MSAEIKMATKIVTSENLPFFEVFGGHDDKDLVVICKDGSIKTFALFLASICPVICQIGKTETDISLYLPDFSVEQVQLFLKLALSNEGPKNKTDEEKFTQMLDFLGAPKEAKHEGIDQLSEEYLEDWSAEEEELEEQLEEDQASGGGGCDFGVWRRLSAVRFLCAEPAALRVPSEVTVVC